MRVPQLLGSSHGATHEHVIPFISLAEEDDHFAGNVAVVSKLASESLQPQGFALAARNQTLRRPRLVGQLPF